MTNNTARVMPDRLAKNATIEELEEILADLDSWVKEEGITIEVKSVRHAIDFVKNVLIPNGIADPYVEVHGDGEAAFTWRKGGRGLLNIAFNKAGFITWGVFLDKTPPVRDNGCFDPKNSISDIEEHIRFITEA